ncbi:MAG: CHAP domain-containing protein [Terricaulis sp.]
MFDRRQVLAGGAALIGAGASAGALAQTSLPDDPFPQLPPELGAREHLPEFVPTRPYDLHGSEQPPELERRVAEALLFAAPYNCRPIDVALYFRGIGQGDIPPNLDPGIAAHVQPRYVRGWDRYYNPVILAFFDATRTRPLEGARSGDTTHWCAAFVNWCIARAHCPGPELRRFTRDEIALGTHSAASSSFRCWEEASDPPQYGDVIVWSLAGAAPGCSTGAGHVAFFESVNAAGRYSYIGGNQAAPNRIEGAQQTAITRSSAPANYPMRDRSGATITRVLHSVRGAASLRVRAQ